MLEHVNQKRQHSNFSIKLKVSFFLNITFISSCLESEINWVTFMKIKYIVSKAWVIMYFNVELKVGYEIKSLVMKVKYLFVI